MPRFLVEPLYSKNRTTSFDTFRPIIAYDHYFIKNKPMTTVDATHTAIRGHFHSILSLYGRILIDLRSLGVFTRASLITVVS